MSWLGRVWIGGRRWPTKISSVRLLSVQVTLLYASASGVPGLPDDAVEEVLAEILAWECPNRSCSHNTAVLERYDMLIGHEAFAEPGSWHPPRFHSTALGLLRDLVENLRAKLEHQATMPPALQSFPRSAAIGAHEELIQHVRRVLN